jgi:quaternary ammonium compound-resistance protein SugE
VAWGILFLAGLCEVVWAVALKESAGFTRLVPSAVSVSFMVLSVALLGFAMRSLPVGTAYAVWTGIGALGVALWGMLHLGEPRTAARLACLLLIVAGIVGLKLSAAKAS